jgi:hypothetical protein
MLVQRRQDIGYIPVILQAPISLMAGVLMIDHWALAPFPTMERAQELFQVCSGSPWIQKWARFWNGLFTPIPNPDTYWFIVVANRRSIDKLSHERISTNPALPRPSP